MSVDLHVHTTASDGLITPAGVVRMALERDLDVIAITDHDSVEGVDEAMEAARGTSLMVLPGLEMSVLGPNGGDAHVLGYLVSVHSPRLLQTLQRLRDARRERAQLMVERLRSKGHAIDFERVLAHAGGGAVGRVHVARTLVEAGSVPSVEHAFSELIGHQGPFYVHKETLQPAEALETIHAAGGLAVLAHPGVSGEDALIPLVDAGLDGIEVYHAEHTPSQRQHFASLASRFGLVATGGSDFHGPGMRSASLGAGECPDSAVGALLERAALVRA